MVEPSFVRLVRLKPLMRLAGGTVVILGLAVLARRYDLPSCTEIQEGIHKSGVWGPSLFGILYILATVLFIPGVLLTLVGGMAFGPVWGTLLVSAASVLGATGSFLIARYIGRDVVEALVTRQVWFCSLRKGLQKRGLNFVLFVRLVPLFPFNALNYACGILPLRLRDFLLGSIIGMLPGTFAFVYLGATGCRLVDLAVAGRFSVWDLPEDIRQSLLIVVGLLGVLSILPVALNVRKTIATKQRNQSDN